MRRHKKTTGLGKGVNKRTGAGARRCVIDVPDEARLTYRRAREAILANRALIVVDGKGGRLLREMISLAAQSAGRVFTDTAPDRPGLYRVPWERFSNQVIATLLVPVDVMCDPCHRRRAQAHVMQVVRFLREAKLDVDLDQIVPYLDPTDLMGLCSRRSLSPDLKNRIQEYVDSIMKPLEIEGYLEYLRILSNCEVSQWFCEPEETGRVDLIEAVKTKAVIYFDLSSYQWPLFGHMLSSAIGADLLSVTESLVGCKFPATVLLRQPSDLPRSVLQVLHSGGRASEIRVISVAGDIGQPA